MILADIVIDIGELATLSHYATGSSIEKFVFVRVGLWPIT